MSTLGHAVHYVHYRNYFPVPLIEKAKEYLSALAKETPSTGTNNESGRSYFQNKWLSSKDLHRQDHPVLQPLLKGTLRAATAYAYAMGQSNLRLKYHSCWGMISQHGLSGAAHTHAGLVSGVTYIDAGDSGKERCGGNLIMHAQPDAYAEIITPRTTDLILFPSSQIHSVEEYTGARERMVISFNLEIAS